MPKMTQISLPYHISAIDGVRTALAGAGFTIGSSGGGTDDFEFEGVLNKRELAKLQKVMAAAIFEEYPFDEYEDDEDGP